MDIAAWLRSLGLEQLEQAFRDNAIDLEVLPELTDEHLKELGVPLGHRLKLLKAIAGLRTGTAPYQLPLAATAPAPSSAAEGERRQVTVLFADLVGYTALSREVDAEDVHALLGRFFDRVDHIVEEYGGHIDKHIGDCVMAVFGAPVAHGNDAERAVRAALAIREAMPELSAEAGHSMRVHIGIAGGQVVASGTGSNIKPIGSASGSRGFTLSTAGCICVGTGWPPPVYGLVAHHSGPGGRWPTSRLLKLDGARRLQVFCGSSTHVLVDIAGYYRGVRRWRAIVRPTPRPPPVTTATWFTSVGTVIGPASAVPPSIPTATPRYRAIVPTTDVHTRRCLQAPSHLRAGSSPLGPFSEARSGT